MTSLFSQQTKIDFDRAVQDRLAEINKDKYFFGGIGMFLAFFANTFDQLEKKGIKLSANFVNDLLSDFMSAKATILIFFLVVIGCALRNIAHNNGYSKASKLQVMAAHMSLRLRQFSSSLTCFSLGFALFLLFSVFFTYEMQAVILAVMIATVGVGMSLFGIMSNAIEAGISDTKETAGSVIMLIIAMANIGYLAVHGF